MKLDFVTLKRYFFYDFAESSVDFQIGRLPYADHELCFSVAHRVSTEKNYLNCWITSCYSCVTTVDCFVIHGSMTSSEFSQSEGN
jgi:hypothetical protein